MPGICTLAGSMFMPTTFLAPTLARCTISFLSPSCIPLRPAMAWSVIVPSRYSANA